MPSLGDVFGEGSTARQLLVWQVLAQVIGALAAPGFTELTKLANNAVPVNPLDPGTAAEAGARHLISTSDAADHIQDSGLDTDLAAIMMAVAQHAPDLSSAFELFRRGAIPEGSTDPREVSLRGVFTDSGIPPAWHDALVSLAVSIPDQSQVLNAWLEGQISEAEARDRLTKAGMDPEWITTAYNANGQAPTPVQALDLLNRGIISEGGTGPGATSYEQAFLEGPWRNKWLPAFKALRWYIPPPRTVTAMFREGSLTLEQATRYLMDSGLTGELAAAYLTAAHSGHTAPDKHLAKSEITQLYHDHLMPRAEAHAALVALKYQTHDADLILDLADARRESSNLSSAVSRLRSLYVAGRLSRTEALSSLGTLKVPTDQAQALVAVWELEHTRSVARLTPAQITHAEYLGLISTDEADAELAAHGYGQFDAWVLRSLQHKAAQKNRPTFRT